MSSVAIFSTSGCPYCKRAKALLAEKEIDAQQIDISGQADLRSALKDISNRTSVPQIFVGGEFFGGSDELVQAVDEGSFQGLLDNAAGKPALPASLKSLVDALEPSDKAGASWNPPGVDPERYAELKAIGKAMTSIRRHNAGSKLPLGRKVHGAFTGQEICDWLLEHSEGGCSTPNEAVALTAELAAAHIIKVADISANEARQAGDLSLEWQLVSEARLDMQLGDALNCHYTWTGSARDANTVANTLRGIILELYDKFLSADGSALDYEGLKGDALFETYVDATAELQAVDLGLLDRDQKIAACINIYNALVIHAQTLFGSGGGLLSKLGFFAGIKYRIGGHEYSADDLEHGVLRGNVPPPSSVGTLIGVPALAKRQFSKGDPRRVVSLEEVDPRIHFALVCGAKSCPPIKLYTPENLEQGLGDAAAAFCDSEIETVDAETLRMSKIFKWYGADFAGGSKDRAEQLKGIAKWCSPEARERINAVLKATGDKPKIDFKEYNWNANSK